MKEPVWVSQPVWASNFRDVGEFHERFRLRVAGDGQAPSMMDAALFMFRYQFLLEELHELLSAYRKDDLVGVADALADLVYVALGTAHMFGVPFDEVFAEVHRANLKKVRAAGAWDERSKRSSVFDVVKPEGWEPPDVRSVLEDAGWTDDKIAEE